jgi:hypothetical protein
MATTGKTYGTKAYPADAKETSGLFRRVEPLITPEQLINKYLKGIPGLDQYTEDDLKAEIELSINAIETESNLIIFKTQMSQRIPFDVALYKSFIHIKTNYRPILSVEKLSVISTNGIDIYNLPLEWLEMGNAHKGQLNLLPILSVFGSSSTVVNGVPSGALIFLQSLVNFAWVPSFWTIEYTAGICHRDGDVPVVLNDIIGCNTAINILSSLSALNVNTSQSLGQDGLSQSSGNLGPNTYNNRIEQLTLRKEKYLAQVKRIYHSKYFVSNF